MATINIELKDDEETGRVKFSLICTGDGIDAKSFSRALKRAASNKPVAKNAGMTRAQLCSLAVLVAVDTFKHTNGV